MGTIVQDYGPIYGEVVNGTVQGRPNGSVYVPLSNTISLQLLTADSTLRQDSTSVYVLGGLTFASTSQDLASYVRTYVYADPDLTSLVAYRNFGAGVFNNARFQAIGAATDDTPALVPGATYYVVAQLMNNGVAVATSTVIEVTAA